MWIFLQAAYNLDKWKGHSFLYEWGADGLDSFMIFLLERGAWKICSGEIAGKASIWCAQTFKTIGPHFLPLWKNPCPFSVWIFWSGQKWYMLLTTIPPSQCPYHRTDPQSILHWPKAEKPSPFCALSGCKPIGKAHGKSNWPIKWFQWGHMTLDHAMAMLKPAWPIGGLMPIFIFFCSIVQILFGYGETW